MIDVIAEWGQSHRGSLDTAKRQADAAKAAGCSYSKWQLFAPERIASRHARRYWDAGLGGSESQIETFTQNGMLSPEDWRELAWYCKGIGITFLVTPFDLEAVDLLENIGVEAYKIASGDITYKQLIEKVAATGKPVFMSTGASDEHEVETALDWFHAARWKGLVPPPEYRYPVTLLACSLAYPCPAEEANLGRIRALEYLGHPLGYSDHTVGVRTAIAAVAAGATVLEKHCRLDESDGVCPDDQMALVPMLLRQYVYLAQRAEVWMGGSVELLPTDAELPARAGARRSLYAARDIKRGDVYARGDFAFLRPSDPNGYEPADADGLYGTLAFANVATGDLIPHP